jgi:putative Holliday junction resolvase
MHEGGTVLAFDFGTRRIGVAIGEMMLGTARPLAVISAEANAARFAAIGRLVAEWQPSTLVVGLPLSLAGEEQEMGARCRRFARQLESRYRLPVVLADERLSSVAADAALRDSGLSWRQRKEAVDAAAAAVLLEGWFAERRTPGTRTS